MAKSPPRTILDWQRAYFRDQADPRLRKTWPTMAVLMTYADRDLECYPSQATIARIAGIKKADTVREHLRLNLEAGWIVKLRTGGPGDGTNRYRFVIPSPLSKGDIPPTEGGHIPPEEGSKLSNRTVHRTVHETDQKRSPLQTGDEAVATRNRNPDPWRGSGDSHKPPATAEQESSGPPCGGGITTSPEERLLAVIRSEGSVGAKSDLPRLMQVSRPEVNKIIPRMIAEGVIRHDTDREYPALVLA